jgi:hypothetical protein
MTTHDEAKAASTKFPQNIELPHNMKNLMNMNNKIKKSDGASNAYYHEDWRRQQ